MYHSVSVCEKPSGMRLAQLFVSGLCFLNIALGFMECMQALCAQRADCHSTNVDAHVGTISEMLQLASENKCLYSMHVLALKDNALMHMRVQTAEQNLCNAWSRVARLEMDQTVGNMQQAEISVLSRNTSPEVAAVIPTPDPVNPHTVLDL